MRSEVYPRSRRRPRRKPELPHSGFRAKIWETVWDYRRSSWRGSCKDVKILRRCLRLLSFQVLDCWSRLPTFHWGLMRWKRNTYLSRVSRLIGAECPSTRFADTQTSLHIEPCIRAQRQSRRVLFEIATQNHLFQRHFYWSECRLCLFGKEEKRSHFSWPTARCYEAANLEWATFPWDQYNDSRGSWWPDWPRSES